jgi:hypothetical protein
MVSVAANAGADKKKAAAAASRLNLIEFPPGRSDEQAIHDSTLGEELITRTRNL